MSHLTNVVDDVLSYASQPEEEARELFLHLSKRFGWTGAIYTREDAEAVLERDMTDEEWEGLSRTGMWIHLPARLLAGTWGAIEFALDDAGITKGGRGASDAQR